MSEKSPSFYRSGAHSCKQQIVGKNQFNMPTYFQIGRNSIEVGDSIYTHNPSNRGLSNFQPGKRYNIPVHASLLSKADSAKRLNLPTKKDSAREKFAAKLRV